MKNVLSSKRRGGKIIYDIFLRGKSSWEGQEEKGFVWQYGLSGHRSQISGGQELYD